MRKFKSTQLREAFKIEVMHRNTDTSPIEAAAQLYDADARVWLPVSRSYVEKHNPQVGGYYVRYPDGYESYCPAESFEAGHEEVH